MNTLLEAIKSLISETADKFSSPTNPSQPRAIVTESKGVPSIEETHALEVATIGPPATTFSPVVPSNMDHSKPDVPASLIQSLTSVPLPSATEKETEHSAWLYFYNSDLEILGKAGFTESVLLKNDNRYRSVLGSMANPHYFPIVHWTRKGDAKIYEALMFCFINGYKKHPLQLSVA
jgi:hypothetical protein